MLIAMKFNVIILLLFVIFKFVSLQWISHSGIWYYVSDRDVSIDYLQAQVECIKREGQLTTLVNDDQLRFVGSATNDKKRWIGYSTLNIKSQRCRDGRTMGWAGDESCSIKQILEIEPQMKCSSAVIYTILGPHERKAHLNAAECTARHGYICQWQCRSLYVVADKIPKISGKYEMQSYHQMRRYYSLADNIHILLVYSPYSWSIVDRNNSIEYVNVYVTHYSPYIVIDWSSNQESRQVSMQFMCVVCSAYTVVIKGDSTNLKLILQKLNPNGIEYGDLNGYVLKMSKGTSASWCVWRNQNLLFCEDYAILPHLAHTVELKTYINSEQVAVNIICVTEVYVAASTEAHSTMSMPSVQSSASKTFLTSSTIISNTSEISTKPTYSTNDIIITANGNVSTEQSYHTQANIKFHDTTTDTTDITGITGTTGKEPIDEQLTSPTHNNLIAMYIGVPCGSVIVVLITVIIAVICYKRRFHCHQTSGNNAHTLGTVHIVTDVNVYTDIQVNSDEYPKLSPQIKHNNVVHTKEVRRCQPHNNNVPVAQSIDQGFSQETLTDSLTPITTPTQPIYASVSKHRKPNTQDPFEHLYSQVKKDNNKNAEWRDSASAHTGYANGRSEEEFSENGINDRSNVSNDKVVKHDNSTSDATNSFHCKQDEIPAKSTVFDDVVFEDDDENDEVEMYDNDIYGQM